METLPHTTPYERITTRILALLEQGTVPWHRPWDSTMGMPRNLFSQRAYKGINVWLLTAMGSTSPFWDTFQQVTAAGGSNTLPSGHRHHPSPHGGLDYANHPRHDRLPESRPAVLRHL